MTFHRKKVLPGKSRNFSGILAGKLWESCRKVAGKVAGTCGKVVGNLTGPCGKKREKVVGSCGKFRDSGNQNLQDEIVLADCKRIFVFYVWFCFVFVTIM